MPVPKRRTSKSKRDQRRTHKKIDAPNLGKCSQCGETLMPHHACMKCGTYNGRKAIEVEE